MYLLYATFPEDANFGDISTQEEFETREAMMSMAKLYHYITDGAVKLRVDKVDV